MTVSSEASKIQYSGNGSTSAFSVTFPYVSEAQIEVIVTSAAGVESTKTNGVQYELSNPGDTGTVTFGVSPVDYRPQTGETVTIRRVLAATQSDDFVSGQGFNSVTIESALDKVYFLAQMLAERISRAPKLRATTVTGELIFPEPEADRIVGWNPAGTALTNLAALDVDLSTATAFGTSLLEAVDAAEGRTLIDAQQLDADLTAIAALTPSNDHILQRKSGAWTNRTIAQLLTDLAAAGTTFQPLDADLTAIAALTTTSYGRALLALADAAALTALGNAFTSALKGLAPASGGGTANFLRADGAWTVPSNIVVGTSQVTTSGTAFDFTSLPAAIKRITVLFFEVSLSGTDNILVQIGDSGGIATTTYSSGSSVGVGSAVGQAASTAGLIIVQQAAARAMSGQMVLTRVATGLHGWVASHSLGSSVNAAHGINGGGAKVLSNELDRLRITRTGTDTFDAGTVNIMYEL